ncbi:hypothetical protein JTB14_031005 [Gonioctena quinquepunctata]|nr:hypothetical protein JTB14_031005 [Gonioctena quinquepunctata]
MKNYKLYLNNKIFTTTELENLEDGSEPYHQLKPRSDPGIPAPERLSPNRNTSKKYSEEFVPTRTKTSTITDITSRENSSTPKTGTSKKFPEKNQIRENTLSLSCQPYHQSRLVISKSTTQFILTQNY